MPARTRKFSFPKTKQDEFLEQIRAGKRRGAAADWIELDRRKVRDFIEENDDFRLAVEDAEVDATEHVEAALYDAAVSGSVAAAKAWIDLKGHNPQKEARGPAESPTEPSEPSDRKSTRLHSSHPILS